jgi:hypothetical protein
VSRAAGVAIAATIAAAGCLGPQVPDRPGASGEILPSGTPVPAIADAEPDDAEAIEAHDGVGDTVPLVTAFSAGGVIHVWDFGAARAVAAPMFVLTRDGAPIDHPPIVGSIPGDPTYSPFWSIFAVEVTDRYDGEEITSIAALSEAEDLGLIAAPQAEDSAVDRPIVAAGVHLVVGGGNPDLAPAGEAYYDGAVVAYFDFGAMPVTAAVEVTAATRYSITRDGASLPIDETVRGVDLTGDGDTVDTNDIYADRPGRDTTSPLVTTVDVVVRASVAAIDTAMDDSISDLRDAIDLFAPDPTAVVLGFSARGDLVHVPGQRQAGGL